jgi:hypothetical protein
MRSLAHLVGDQTVLLAELGDKSPTSQRLNDREPGGRYISGTTPIPAVLASQHQSWILWGLSRIISLSNSDIKYATYLPDVIKLFQHPSVTVEYAAISCCITLSTSFPSSVAPCLVTPIVRRLAQSPAIEYVKCLRLLGRHLDVRVVKERIFPMLLKFVGKGEDYQFAAGELLWLLHLCQVKISNDNFLLFLSSAVIVAHYLPVAIALSSNSLGTAWQENTMPKELLLQANSFPQLREGATSAIIPMFHQIDGQQAFLWAMTAFGWAQTNESVGIVLIENADTLGRFRSGEFQVKVRDLGIRLSQSPSVNRAQLCCIYAHNPITFLSSKVHLWRVYKELSEDPDIEVRLAFVKYFHLLYEHCSSMELKDRLFSCLLPYFNVAAGQVLHRALIENGSIFRAIKNLKLAAILPSFLKIIESLHNWRLISAAVQLFIAFPGQLFQQGWAEMAALVRQKMASSPHSLAEIASSFYLAGCVMNEHAVVPFLVEYSESPRFQLRSFFLNLSVATAYEISPPIFIEWIIPATVKLADDPVLEVRAAFIRICGQLRDILLRIREINAEKCLTATAMRLGKEKDPYLHDVWLDCFEHLQLSFPQEDRVALLERPAAISRSTVVLQQPMAGSETTRHRSTGPVLTRPRGMLAKRLRGSGRSMPRGWPASACGRGRTSDRNLAV